MPVKVIGKRIVEISTGKTVGVSKSHKFAVISAYYRNKAHKTKMLRKKTINSH